MNKAEPAGTTTPLTRSSRQEEAGRFQIKDPRFELTRDVVLPESTRLQLDECIAKIDFHRQIYVDWGFSAVDPMGRSTILNFYGPPGTGKTLAAEAFAGSLHMPIVHISIAELESKYMGETAKNLQAAFSAAYEADAVLFFDEADTLLGKRLSSVTQGIDNEVNAMRSTLLIELERFDGIVIFATNFARNYDEAFRSRITHHVRFDLPDEKARAGIWSRMLVERIPLVGERDSLVAAAAARSASLSGREIRTCMRLALPKALLAARASNTSAQLSIQHLDEAIAEVMNARRDVASPVRADETGHAATRKLLGIDS
ncbi:hypothetical protein PPGU19_092480 (plasmid) [Paraburkholderia sp. PGU19]|uniref:ATP-binding protein n=1 Tax=Paraburkholderia sp. PGU19 TaxID=2735434 RepID=UPI0015DC3729|nr:ATP-binding protein [Paraburkholderia sp. PGU19]BCG04680.1 hypothetical protein PPGU19_092480 [Paraburkholderia sp. PGU19]